MISLFLTSSLFLFRCKEFWIITPIILHIVYILEMSKHLICARIRLLFVNTNNFKYFFNYNNHQGQNNLESTMRSLEVSGLEKYIYRYNYIYTIVLCIQFWLLTFLKAAAALPEIGWDWSPGGWDWLKIKSFNFVQPISSQL